MKKKIRSFEYYAKYSLIFLLVLSSVWLYFDYQSHAKWSRWQQMIDSGQYQPVAVKLTRIQKIVETQSAGPYVGGYHSPVAVTHHQGWLVDKNGGVYKEWIVPSKLSSVKVGNTYKLYDLDGVVLVPAFIERTPKKYAVSSEGWAGLAILFGAFSLYMTLIYFALKLNKGARGIK